MLELGRGFASSVGRSASRSTATTSIDLVFYNYATRCSSISNRHAHASDLGQMQMYVNYYARADERGRQPAGGTRDARTRKTPW
ncbi:MAG: hypothetical protein ACLT98_08600 [Eggerthellaceae bacterium]